MKPERITLGRYAPLVVQRLGGLRLVALGRPAGDCNDLRLFPAQLLADPETADAAHADDARVTYYVPHGLWVGRTEAGRARCVYGTQLIASRAGGRHGRAARVVTADLSLPYLPGDRGWAFAPERPCLEGQILQQAGASAMHWETVLHDATVRRAVHGAGPGRLVDEAVRVFERVAGQCGVLVYAGDLLLLALVLPNAADWAGVHRAVVTGLLGGALRRYGLAHAGDEAAPFRAEYPGTAVRTLVQLRAALAWNRARSQAGTPDLGQGLDHGPLVWTQQPSADRFRLARVRSDLGRTGVQHLGEVVLDREGEAAVVWVQWLSAANTDRAYLAGRLVAAGYSAEAVARELQRPPDSVTRWIERAGYRGLLGGAAGAGAGPKGRRGK